MILDVLLWGTVIGVIHFVVVGILYQNPIVAKMYKEATEAPGVKIWKNQKEYLLKMFLGTQLEVYILTASYLYLRTLFSEPTAWTPALILATVFAGIRVYPRFWNMWIQSTYPGKLLAVEFINGILSTFVVVIGLKLLPV